MDTYEPLAVPEDGLASKKFGFEPCAGGVCAAKGVKAAGIHAGFRKNPGRKDLSLVAADEAVVCAATFTTNRFCAAPVQVDRPRAARGVARAVLLNSGNANAATGAQGLVVARRESALLADALGCAEGEVLVASTGVIGLQMDIAPFETGIPEIVSALDATPAAAHAAAEGVMTTDTHPKEAALAGAISDGADGEVTVHVGGFVKGSGMIQPNMATMLAVITTDARLSAEAARALLLPAVQRSFNKVTVDSDTSTNDSCFLLATGAAGGPVVEPGTSAFEALAAALDDVCQSLARQIAADGEGSTKLVTVDVLGAATEQDAETVARAIANSPLVKTAIFGHDANWGRVAAAAGKCGVPFDQEKVDIDFLGVPVCRAGLTVEMDEDDMLRRFEADEVPIAISLGMGDSSCRVWTCDLTHDYVTINGEYRT